MKKKENRKETNKDVWPPASKTDPNGSYTGKPENPDEVPVQDADDL